MRYESSDRDSVSPTTDPPGQEIPVLVQKDLTVRTKSHNDRVVLLQKGRGLLTQAFSNLGKLGVGTHVIVSSSAMDDVHACHGFASMKRFLGSKVEAVEPNNFGDPSYYETTATVLSALLATSYPARVLTITKGRHKQQFFPKTIRISRNTVHSATAALPCLKALAFHLETTGHDDFEELWKCTVWHGKDLRKLLGVTSTIDERLRDLLWLDVAACFNTIELWSIRAPADNYIKFLDCFKHTLTRLVLEGASIHDGECWSTAFAWLAENTSLEYLGIRNLHIRSYGYHMLLWEGKWLDCELEGVNAIKEALGKFVKAPEYEWEGGSEGDDEEDD